MKKILLATSALVATAGLASAQGVAITGSASMGVLGGDWVADRTDVQDPGGTTESPIFQGGAVIDGQSEYELHTDIDVNFTMSGQTDTGLTFGASIDLDESDGDGARGNSNAFDNRTQGGEEIFISGGFGTLTMGDTDGALDWALQEIAIGGSLGDVHTTHAGYHGNQLADAKNGGQIARWDYSFGDFGVAISTNISDTGQNEDDILAVGAKYNASLPAMELGFGIGYSQLGHDRKEDDAIGVSLDADFNNGFRAILNWVDMGDALNTNGDGEQYMGIGLGYTVDDWTIAANWGQISEDDAGTDDDPERSGYALVVNYDLGGGAVIQFGYSKASCSEHGAISGPAASVRVHGDCTYSTGDNAIPVPDGDRISLGVAMSF